MNASHQNRIQSFEQRYLRRLQNWTGYMPAEDLDALLNVIQEVQTESEAITALLRHEDPGFFQTDWRPVLEKVQILLPNLMNQLELLKRNARQEMGQLGRGEKGLRGYRNSYGANQTFFESEG